MFLAVAASFGCLKALSLVTERNLGADSSDLTFDPRLNPGEDLGGGGFKSEDQSGLGIGRTNQSPPFLKDQSETVHGDNLLHRKGGWRGWRRGEDLAELIHQEEFPIVRTIEADFRGGKGLRKTGEKGRKGSLPA